MGRSLAIKVSCSSSPSTAGSSCSPSASPSDGEVCFRCSNRSALAEAATASVPQALSSSSKGKASCSRPKANRARALLASTQSLTRPASMAASSNSKERSASPASRKAITSFSSAVCTSPSAAGSLRCCGSTPKARLLFTKKARRVAIMGVNPGWTRLRELFQSPGPAVWMNSVGLHGPAGSGPLQAHPPTPLQPQHRPCFSAALAHITTLALVMQ